MSTLAHFFVMSDGLVHAGEENLGTFHAQGNPPSQRTKFNYTIFLFNLKALFAHYYSLQEKLHRKRTYQRGSLDLLVQRVTKVIIQRSLVIEEVPVDVRLIERQLNGSTTWGSVDNGSTEELTKNLCANH